MFPSSPHAILKSKSLRANYSYFEAQRMSGNNGRVPFTEIQIKDGYMSSEPQSSLTPLGVSRVEQLFVNVDDNLNEEDECNVEAFEPPPDTTMKEAEVENPFQVFKKPRRSKV
ncbi:hypothetical protein V6N11_076968 [Hibiscus sabdariffa]|uniref:Uncharacterized protein n=1 Tax=Hibiscus sabdariffa TaxID=183260 RepID=A0ABR2TBP0_9ROSI